MQKQLTTFAILLATIILFSCTNGTQGEKRRRREMPTHPHGSARTPGGTKGMVGLGLVTEKIDTVRVGFIGLGMSGSRRPYSALTHIPGQKL
jgi:hypothetical protein